MTNNDQKFLAEKIRTQYVEKESTELEALRALDKKVKRPVNLFSYLLGSLGAIVMGAGMSLVMTELGRMLGMESTMILGIVIGCVGLATVLLNYPLHKKLMKARKAKYAQEILLASEKILHG